MDKLTQANNLLTEAVDMLTEWVKEDIARANNRGTINKIRKIRAIVASMVPNGTTQISTAPEVPETSSYPREDVDPEDME
jgi:hypothetical protein